jgi:succinyl-CoA synthetase beta subunit
MNIHEHQAKAILASYGIATPRGGVAYTPEEAVAVAHTLHTDVVVVKAQIHAGGRGKAGGVKLAKSRADVLPYASELLGKVLITHQTGSDGKQVQRLLIEEGCDIAKEYYVAVVVDRGSGRVVVMASSEGGMDIEEVAERTPERIVRETVDPVIGLMPFQARNIAFALGIPKQTVGAFVALVQKLYTVFISCDCAIAEINPLVLTGTNEWIALDAKLSFDANALVRQPEIVALRDLSEEDAREIQASAFDLSYIALDGNIGCMVNGAGLAMATMDIISHYGGRPANFLDVGGGATTQKVTEAFKIILSDASVKGIFVNIFGGIMRCDVIAEGIIAAAREVGLDRPLVVRLEGTNVQQGKQLLAQSSLAIHTADSMADGAQKIVALVSCASAEGGTAQ